MWHSFSSIQLDYRQNPSLSNIMIDAIPTLEGATSSKIVAVHVNGLHKAT